MRSRKARKNPVRSTSFENILRRVGKISYARGVSAGKAAVRDIGRRNIRTMGEYEYQHFSLADFDENFSSRLHDLIVVYDLDDDQAARLHEKAWRQWFVGNRAGIRSVVPNAKEAGED